LGGKPVGLRVSAMAIEVRRIQEPAEVLEVADSFLLSRPTEHNVVLTLLEARRRQPQPGRYWLISDGSDVQGVGFQSPLSFVATVTPMPVPAARALADVMAGEDPPLPGLNGEAPTAAALAGQWTERTKLPAVPWQGQRLYQARAIRAPRGVPGDVRLGRPADRDQLVEWVRAFHQEATPEEPANPAATVDSRLPAGDMWVWDDGEPRSMTTLAPATAGVVRIQAVYTPPAHRGRGFAGAMVASLSEQILGQGDLPALYADLGNPVSNSIYRRIGFECVAEILRYRFG